MRHVIAAAAGVIALTIATGASASTASQREYKRGYADCAAGRWDENQHGDSYKRGCRAAEDKRSSAQACPADVSEADRYKYPACNGGGAPRAKMKRAAKISDLKGKDSIKSIDVMTSRGFRSVDSITSGNTLYGIYYNPTTGQCVQLTNADDRVLDARDIGTHPNCK
jgi:hypothetical protein